MGIHACAIAGSGEYAIWSGRSLAANTTRTALLYHWPSRRGQVRRVIRIQFSFRRAMASSQSYNANSKPSQQDTAVVQAAGVAFQAGAVLPLRLPACHRVGAAIADL